MMNTTRLVEYDRPAYMTGLAHRVRVPQAAGRRPTVVMIHGRHGNEDVTWVFAKSLPQDWLLIAPRAIEWEPETEESEVGYSWLLQDDRIPAQSGLWPTFDDFQDATIALEYFIKALPDIYQADPEQIYLLGFSQGAAAAFALAAEHPELVKGIASLVGFVPKMGEAAVTGQVLKDLPVFMAAGVKDKRVPVGIAQESAERVRQMGADLTYNEYNTGHRLNGAGMRDLTAWWLGFE